MTEPAARAALELEARTFARALTGEAPTDYVVAEYARAHEHLPLAPAAPFDRTLLALAAQGSLATRTADAYSRFFAPASALRRKLAVLTAVLESSAPGDRAYRADATALGTVVELVVLGTGFAALLLVGCVLLAPLHVVTRLTGRAA